ncbi:MAG: glycosyltransferase family 4 protein [Pseudomonadota bacterium]
MGSGGGAEHFRGLHRALLISGLEFRLIAARLQENRRAFYIDYISRGSAFWRYYLALWLWFWRHRSAVRDHDVFHFHRNYAAWPKYVFCGRRGRVLISYHNVSGRVLQGMLGHLGAPIRAMMLALERLAVARADALVCVSDRDRRILERVVLEPPFAHAAVIPAGYDEEIFDRTDISQPDPSKAHDLLFMGRLSHQKNVPLAVATLEELLRRDARYRLTIAGDGEGSRELMQRLARSPAGHAVDWVGRVPHDQVPALLASHGMVLLSSRYEASPTVVKEAIRGMRPVVSTDVGDVTDWIEDGKTGFICDAIPPALADGVEATTEMIETGSYQPSGSVKALNENAIMSQVMNLYRQLAAS